MWLVCVCVRVRVCMHACVVGVVWCVGVCIMVTSGQYSAFGTV